MKILHFADLHLGVEIYGHIDPSTGLSTRLLDFLAAFDKLVDYALQNSVDLVVFCGDAYKSREPTPTQQREFAKRVNRLASNNIPVFLLVGNHDVPNAMGRATATEIFETLAVKNVYVSSKPEVLIVPTRSGNVQVATLPWLRRSAFLAKEDTKNLTFEQINQTLQQILTGIITASASQLDPKLPSILAAHVWVSGASVGSERSMTIGQEHELLLSNVANPAFDYIALGHIHRHQVLKENPPVVYAGSLERLDFGEKDDDKGFYVVDIEPDESSKRKVSFTFHPLSGRRFLTIDINIEPQEIDPTAVVLGALLEQKERVKDTIVQLKISLPLELESQLRDNELRSVLKEAYYFNIAKDIKRETRFRLSSLTAEEITPGLALIEYLKLKKVSEERAKLLQDYGEKLIEEHSKQI